MSTTSHSEREEATMTATTDIINTENELNTQRNNAFFFMVRMGHMNPGVASALASIYRAALTCNTYVRQQAEHHDIDTAWLYFLYSTAAFIALGITEMGMSFGAMLLGMAKWLMLVPALGIPVWKVSRRRGLGEIVDFFSKERERGDDRGGEVDGR